MDKPIDPLRIQSMTLSNFRGIASINLDFHPQLTLLAGRNGVGKTSLLAAVSKCYVTFGGSISSIRYRGITFDDTDVRKSFEGLPSVSAEFYDVDRKADFPSFIGDRSVFKVYELALDKKLPIVVNYSQDRAFKNEPAKADSSVFKSSFDATLNAVGHFKNWFFNTEIDEALDVRDTKNVKFRNPELEAIRKVVTSIDGIDGITSRAENGNARDLYFIKHGHRISIDQLSSGERVYFILAADLARRLIVAFPDETIETAPGLVLIDEIELHLHPAWQRKIIRQLRETFRNCQFVITTHSPQVMGGVEAECIRLLSADDEGNVSVKTPKASYGRNSADILEALLEVDPRVPEVENMLDDARNAIDERRFDEANRLLTELAETIEGDAPTVTLLRARMERLKMQDAS